MCWLPWRPRRYGNNRSDMKPSLTIFNRPLIASRRHAVLIALVVGLCFDGWLGWESWQQWSDQPLPPDRVTAKQLRVSETQRTQFVENLAAYQHPPAVPTIPAITFQASSTE